MNYGKALRVARAARGLSQKDLAHLTDLDPSYISLLESGERQPSSSTLLALSQALGVPPHLLMLLASDKNDLRGLNAKEASDLGGQLLRLIVEAEGEPTT